FGLATNLDRKLTFVELKKTLLETAERLRSFHVIYTVHRDERQLRREIVALAPFWLIHDSSKGSASADWRKNLDHQRAYLLDGRVVNFYPLNRRFVSFKWSPHEGLPGTLVGELFILATGFWPLSECTPPRPLGHAHVLPEVARASDFELEENLTKE